MKKVTLFLDSSEGIFARWLDGHTALISSRLFFTEKGYLCVQRARATPGLFQAPSRIDMDAIYVWPSEKEDVSSAQPIGAVISFKVVPLASERIELTAECSHPVFEDYFAELLTAIEERWPEARSVPQPIQATTAPSRHTGDGEASVTEQPFEPKDMRERRQKVKRLRSEGLTILQISLTLGYSESTVKRDISKLKERGEL